MKEAEEVMLASKLIVMNYDPHLSDAISGGASRLTEEGIASAVKSHYTHLM